MSINTNINDYSIQELYSLANLNLDDTKDKINKNFTEMIQDYLNNKPYTKMCQNIGICSKKLPGGIPGAKKAKRM